MRQRRDDPRNREIRTKSVLVLDFVNGLPRIYSPFKGFLLLRVISWIGFFIALAASPEDVEKSCTHGVDFRKRYTTLN